MAATVATQTLAQYDKAQVRKAIKLVETGAIKAVGGGDYAVKSSSGDAAYLVNGYRQTCTCPAGTHGRRCYHLAAAIALDEGANR